MDHFLSRDLFEANGFRGDVGHAAGELRAVQIADAHNISLVKLAFGTGDAGRKQTFALLAQRFLGAFIDVNRAARTMEKGDPAFAAGEAALARDKKRPFFFSGYAAGDHASLFAGSDHERDSGAR